MTPRARLDRWAAIAAAIAIAAYCLAARNIELGVLAAFVVGLRWLIGRTTSTVAAPRWIVNIVAAIAVLWTLGRALGIAGTRLDIDGFSVLLTLLLLGKLFDWTKLRDAAQVLMLSAFLGIGAVLTSNELRVFLALGALCVSLALGAAWFQLAVGDERYRRAHTNLGRDPLKDEGETSLVARVLGVGLPIVLGISAAVFLLMPRGLGDGLFGEVRSASLGERSTGFTDRVQLGAGGLISTSPTIVLDMVVSDGDGKRLGGLMQPYYLRGAVLDRYDQQTREWNATAAARPQQLTTPAYTVLLTAPTDEVLVQDITIRSAPAGDSYLFCVWSPVSVKFARSERFIQGQARTHALRRRGRGGKLQYTVVSAVPAPARSVAADIGLRFRPIQSEQWPGVRDLTRRVLQDAGVDPDEVFATATESLGRPIDAGRVRAPSESDVVVRAASVLSNWLRREFAYTLEPEAAPADRDPVEWFLLDARQGHCEYFAAGLTAMCRTVGIGARVVTGYLATEYNESSEHYVVRESDAHAWTEIEVAPGTWRTYDATPQADLSRIHEPSQSVWAQVGRMLDAVEYAWINSVVSFDESARSELFGLPRIEETRLARRVQSFGRRLEAGGVGLFGRAVLNAGLAFGGTLVVGWAVGAGVLFAHRRLRRGADRSGGAPIRALHDEALRALRRFGKAKPDSAPIARHAQSLAREAPELSGLVGRAAEILYAVQFGGRPLTPERWAEAERLIADLRAVDMRKPVGPIGAAQR
ncbi:MAG: DUF3488 and transglutaminase-like domain-containing protein [Planctomycetota bacterium]